MISYRVESSSAATGEYEHTEVLHSKREMIDHCTADWRRGSVHAVYILHAGLPPRLHAVFAAGRCVSPLTNDLYPRG
jgi:hypothetical protein